MLERRAGRRVTSAEAAPIPKPVPVVIDNVPTAPITAAAPAPPSKPKPKPATQQPAERPAVAAPLVDFARRIAAEHQQAHGEPITPGKSRARLGVSDQLAADLLDRIRTA
jgi:hypothetical protein